MRIPKRVIAIAVSLVTLLSLIPCNRALGLAAPPAGAGAVVLEGGMRDMAWPVPSSAALSSCFLDPESSRNHVHHAIDIAGFREATIVPVYDGTVYMVMDNDSPGNSGYGNCVIVKHTYTLGTGEIITLYSRYAHMHSIAVKQGQKVTKGVTRLGGVGGSGAEEDTYPDHLDFQLIYTPTGSLTYGELVNRSVTSIDPFVNQFLELPEKINSSGASSWCTCCHDYVEYLKALYAEPMRYSYLIQCKAWPSHAAVTVTEKTAVYSQPCTEDTLDLSADLETAVPGMTYTATALYQNPLGEFWYRVAATDGGDGYIRAAHTELTELLYSDVSVIDASWPTVHRRYAAFSLKGMISGGASKLVGIRATLSDDTQEVFSVSEELDCRRYSLPGSAVDNGLAFGKLPAGGHTYTLEVTVRNYYPDPDGITVREAEQTVTLLRERFSVVTDLNCIHSYATRTLEPTCTQPGYTALVCDCGYTQYTDTKALGHDCPQWTAEVPVTCTEDGLESSECLRCRQRQERIVKATGHDNLYKWTEKGCQGVSMTRSTCVRCGLTEVTYLDKDYSPWQEDKPEAVPENMLRSRVEYRTQSRETTTDTVETKEGWTQYDTATGWGKYSDWSDWTKTQTTADDTTQVETRQLYPYFYYECANCGTRMHAACCYSWAGGCGKNITAPMQTLWLELAWDKAELKNFCGTGMYYTQYQGKNIFRLYGTEPVTEYRSRTRAMETIYHFERWKDWSDWTAMIQEADESLRVETRLVYSYVLTNGKSHSYEPEITAPGCIQSGYTTYQCTGCNDSYRAENTEPVGHRYGPWQPETDATCTQPGTRIRACQACEALEREETELQPHSYENGVCTHCGQLEYAPGDVDRNGRVDIFDVTKLIYYLNGRTKLEDRQLTLADLNSDNKVNIFDVTRLIYMINNI